MSGLKSLAKDTAIYGMSSIVGRFLNYLLVPLYTAKMSAASGGYGIVTNIYAMTALLLVILTYGMETGFFRYVNKKDCNPDTVYSTVIISVGTTSLLFTLLCYIFLGDISSLLGYAEHPEYIMMMACVVAMDAFQNIPFAYLRHKKKALKFAAIKFVFIIPNILLNLFFFIACPYLLKHYPVTVDWFYSPSYGVGYVFVANLICTGLQMLCLMPELTGFKYRFDMQLLRSMLKYSFPILILGIAGILNQTVDKIIFRFVYPDSTTANAQLGIYGATSKIAMIMAMLTQAFRYAYEPFVFGKNKDKDNKETYAKAMKFFIIFTLLAYLGVMCYIDILKYIIQPDYWEGLRVIPIVMAAEIFMGINFNLSFWYKLTDNTKWGAYLSIIGCIVIISLNIIFVPKYGYMACAWAGFFGYLTIMLLSYFIGQKKYPIDYDLGGITMYALLAVILLEIRRAAHTGTLWIDFLTGTLLIAVFIVYIVKKDFPLKDIPVINRLIKK